MIRCTSGPAISIGADSPGLEDRGEVTRPCSRFTRSPHRRSHNASPPTRSHSAAPPTRQVESQRVTSDALSLRSRQRRVSRRRGQHAPARPNPVAEGGWVVAVDGRRGIARRLRRERSDLRLSEEGESSQPSPPITNPDPTEPAYTSRASVTTSTRAGPSWASARARASSRSAASVTRIPRPPHSSA